MLKIGILTFHRALNYGAVLQGYALQYTLNQLPDCQCEVVDYRSAPLESQYSAFRRLPNDNALISFVKCAIKCKVLRKKSRNFQNFLNEHFLLSSESYDADTIEKANLHYDVFITGSDQVWSPNCVGFDPIYFLTFANAEKKYSYAASFGCKKIPEGKKEKYQKRLQGFQRISVREENGRQLLASLEITQNVMRHIDPTLLLEQEQWRALVEKPQDSHYVLLFTVNKPIHAITYARSLAKAKNLRVIYVNDKPMCREKGIEYRTGVSPAEFLGYICYADYIVTNSFHGTAFSVIFQKDFYAELETQTGYNSRAEELLSLLEIQGHEVTGTVWKEAPACDWKKASEKLAVEKQRSIAYFHQILEDKNE